MPQLQRVEQLITQHVTKQQALKPLNAFINLPTATTPSNAPTKTDGPLSGRYVAIKDNICTTDLPTTCASAGLRNFRSPFNATVVNQLLSHGAIIAGKTNLDEFGMGSHSAHSFFGAVKTEQGHSAGGSSGGSAVAVATGQCSSALGTDTGGSVRLPAAYNDIVGFKPSYGLVSRWGLVAYANSLDTVGFLGKDVASTRQLFETCNVHDPQDPTSLSPATRSRVRNALASRPQQNSLRIGIPREYNMLNLSSTARSAWQSTIRKAQAAGHIIHSVSLPHTSHALSAYYVLAPAEASSNLAKYDGVRYGAQSLPPDSTRSSATPQNQPSISHSQTPQDAKTQPGPGNNLYTATRGAFFGSEVRRRILLGAYTLSADAIDNYFLRAQRIRRLVSEDFNHVFALAHPLRDSSSHAGELANSGGVDILLTPTAPGPPPMLEDLERKLKEDPTEQYTSDVFTVPSSLAGVPAVSLPSGTEGIGVQVIGQFGDDGKVLEVAEELGELCASKL